MSEQEKSARKQEKCPQKNAPLMLHLVQADLQKNLLYCRNTLRTYTRRNAQQNTHAPKTLFQALLAPRRRGEGGGIGESGVVGAGGGGGGGGGGEPTSLVLPEREPPALYLKPPPPPLLRLLRFSSE